jgi:hypothetical protein
MHKVHEAAGVDGKANLEIKGNVSNIVFSTVRLYSSVRRLMFLVPPECVIHLVIVD